MVEPKYVPFVLGNRIEQGDVIAGFPVGLGQVMLWLVEEDDWLLRLVHFGVGLIEDRLVHH